MAKELILSPLQKKLLRKFRKYFNDHLDKFSDHIDEDVEQYIEEEFFLDEGDFLAWEYFVSHDCMNEKITLQN